MSQGTLYEGLSLRTDATHLRIFIHVVRSKPACEAANAKHPPRDLSQTVVPQGGTNRPTLPQQWNIATPSQSFHGHLGKQSFSPSILLES